MSSLTGMIVLGAHCFHIFLFRRARKHPIGRQEKVGFGFVEEAFLNLVVIVRVDLRPVLSTLRFEPLLRCGRRQPSICGR